MCKDNWWLALLYVQNYFSGHRMVRKLWMNCVMYGIMILNQHYLRVMAFWKFIYLNIKHLYNLLETWTYVFLSCVITVVLSYNSVLTLSIK
jgi:hypothetical protein